MKFRPANLYIANAPNGALAFFNNLLAVMGRISPSTNSHHYLISDFRGLILEWKNEKKLTLIRYL
ncbi:hypothetical protein [Persicobacter psychrovividus]|uniref:hypothetical protein n=1 Tax=Persicobacter psychrovividus TaxID=387638 RepID=UPI0030CA3B9F